MNMTVRKKGDERKWRRLISPSRRVQTSNPAQDQNIFIREALCHVMGTASQNSKGRKFLYNLMPS